MKTRFFVAIILAGVLLFPILPHAQEENTQRQNESAVRFDLLETAKNLMSCAAFYKIHGAPEQSAFFRSETKYIFMADSTQTEEETASWLAAAETYYNGFWKNAGKQDISKATAITARQKEVCRDIKAGITAADNTVKN